MKDFKSVLLILLSACLIGTWIFFLYDKSQKKAYSTEKYLQDSAVTAQAIKNAFNDSINKSTSPGKDTTDNNNLIRDTSKTTLNNSPNEAPALKKNQDDIQEDGGSPQRDYSKFKKNTEFTEIKTGKFKNENSSLQTNKNKENVRVRDNNVTSGIPVKSSSKNAGNTDVLFTVSGISLSAANSRSNDIAVNSINEADGFIFSFKLQNDIVQNANYEVFVVLLNPENKVLQSDQWDAAENYFITGKEGRKAFTKKIRFDYIRGEQKTLSSSVESENIITGLYTLKIYFNGILIGQLKKQFH